MKSPVGEIVATPFTAQGVRLLAVRTAVASNVCQSPGPRNPRFALRYSDDCSIELLAHSQCRRLGFHRQHRDQRLEVIAASEGQRFHAVALSAHSRLNELAAQAR